MPPEEFIRLANNFYLSKNLDVGIERIGLDSELISYVIAHKNTVQKYKIAFVFICLNPLYWEFAKPMVEGAQQFFLPGHSTDYFFWTDIPEDMENAKTKILESWQRVPEKNIDITGPTTIKRADTVVESIKDLKDKEYIKFIPTEAIEWPYPTLLRYNLFLQEEEKLKEYDYIFYCDVDMRFEGVVGDEILGDITAAQHPMYALKKQYWPPYEPNPESASYIKRPGKIINENGVPRFAPLYYAGGFQGGKSDKFIEAMKSCKELIETDLNKGYVPIWNDESAWNKYLFDHEPSIVLSPAYVHPDSLVEEYYVPLWGQRYPRKLVTLTKWFTTSKAGGEAVKEITQK